MLELLAPAGSREAVTAAVQNGADAVYLGLGDFNARRGAANFGRPELEETVEYCHLRGVKVYLTLNTLLSDRELPRAAEEVAFVSRIGVDAVLVQDLGVLSMVRRVAPDLPVHASTQMSLMNLDGVRLAARLGCTRAVLARELPAGEIAGICKNAPIEIETFVHGAQCMCYSGQCLFSSVIGGRSGNRGLCAQPCRLGYGWGDRADQPLLSLKDMSLSGHLKELEEMGVACVKIEGRMKRPEYVAVVTGIYSAAIRERREPTSEELQRLKQAFSREGFSDGYFTDRTGRHMFGTRREEQEPRALFAAARQEYAREHPRVPLEGSISVRGGEVARLTLTDGVDTVSVSGPIPETARTRELTGADAAARMGKMGGTPFYLERFDARVEPGLMLSVSSLNSMRREALEEISRCRTALPVRRQGNFVPFDGETLRREMPGYTVALRTARQLTAGILERQPRVVYLPAEELERVPRALFERARETGTELSVILPRVLWDRETPKLESLLKKGKEAGVISALVTAPGGVELARRAGLSLRGDFSLNYYNAETGAVLRELGFLSGALSFEQRLARIRDTAKALDTELLAYGRIPLMITENCIVKNRDGTCRQGCKETPLLLDRKGARFPVMRAYGCRNEIFNALPLYLGDKMEELCLAGVWALRLSFTTESPEECLRIYDSYLGRSTCRPEPYTRGLYYRDVE